MRVSLIVGLCALWLLAPAHLGAPARTPDGLAMVVQEAEARRFGGGRSFGFRGSRGFGGFGSRSFSRRQNFGSRPRASGFSRRALPRRSLFGGGLGAGLFSGIGGFLLGGMLGRMMFGGAGLGGGLGGGGIGILEILLVGGVIFFIFRMMRNRSAAAYRESGHAGARYAEADPYGVGGYEEEARGGGGDVYRGPDIGAGRGAVASAGGARRDSRAEAGLRRITDADPSFSEQAFLSLCRERFLQFQRAWTARDLGSVRDLLDADMRAEIERDLEGLRRERKVNRLDAVEIARAEVVEAWNEEGHDFITVRYEASLCDYVVREGSEEVLEGSRTERVRFSEHWTWARPQGPNEWFLSAIEQA